MVRSADRPNRFWGLDDTWQWLEQANLDRGAVVNLDWASPGAGGQIPFGTALHWILSDRAVLYTSLNFTLDHGVVVVSTDTDLSKHRLPVVYNIRDLIDIATATQPKASRQDAIDELKSLIMDTIARDSWDENGGNVGSLSEMGDVLVITQTLASQRQILELLTTL